MNARGVIFVLVLGLSGFVAAEFLVTGNCYDTPSPAVFQVLNGNCIKGEDKYYEMIIPSNDLTTYYLYHFADSKCSNLKWVESGAIAPYSGCGAPVWAYLRVADPENEITVMLGQSAFVTAQTYDNCTTTSVKTYQPVGQCSWNPETNQSTMIRCGSNAAIVSTYSDAQCNSLTGTKKYSLNQCSEFNTQYYYCVSSSAQN
jgi:hypothetical protein